MAKSPRQIDNITQLPHDLLFECCHYLEEEDIYSLSNVCKDLSKIAMDARALSETILYDLDQSKIDNPRYSMVKGLYINGDDSIKIPNQLAQRLRVLIVDDADHMEYEHEFQNLRTIIVKDQDPTNVFANMSHAAFSKLTGLVITDTAITRNIFQWIFKFDNLQHLDIPFIDDATGMNDAQFVTEFNLNNARAPILKNLKRIGMDAVSIVKLRSFFHHIMATSPIAALDIHQEKCASEYVIIDEADLSSIFGDNFDKSKIIHMLSHLKHITLDHSWTANSMNILRRLGSCITTSNICLKLDSFYIHSQLMRDSLASPINSINIYDALDVIVANTKHSKLRLGNFNSFPHLRLLADQFHRGCNKNKKCFTELEIVGEFESEMGVYARWAAFADLGGEEIAFSCKEYLDELWFNWSLHDWIRMCDPASTVCLNGFGIEKFKLEIELHSNKRCLKLMKERYADNYDSGERWLSDFNAEFQNNFTERIVLYENPRLTWRLYQNTETQKEPWTFIAIFT